MRVDILLQLRDDTDAAVNGVMHAPVGLGGNGIRSLSSLHLRELLCVCIYIKKKKKT